MPELSTLTLFFAAALVILIIPGPAVAYAVARSIDQGRAAGIVSTLGLGVGTLFHVAAAALGISALLVSSALTFNVAKYSVAIVFMRCLLEVSGIGLKAGSAFCAHSAM